MIYRVKSGARLPVSAQVAGEECERLESNGMLTPKNLVDASRPDDAPLHKCFEWNDGIAAERWRETQAAYIIRSVEVKIEEHSDPTRAFVATITDNTREYKSIGYVMRRSDSREVLLESAKREALAFRRKYKNLYELAAIIDAIDGVIGSQGRLELAG